MWVGPQCVVYSWRINHDDPAQSSAFLSVQILMFGQLKMHSTEPQVSTPRSKDLTSVKKISLKIAHQKCHDDIKSGLFILSDYLGLFFKSSCWTTIQWHLPIRPTHKRFNSFNPLPVKLSSLIYFFHLLEVVSSYCEIHNFQWVKTTSMSLIWDQTLQIYLFEHFYFPQITYYHFIG